MGNPNSDAAAAYRAFADVIDPRLLPPGEGDGIEKSAANYMVTASDNCRLIAGMMDFHPYPLSGPSFYVDNPVVNRMLRHLYKLPRVGAASEEQVRRAYPLWKAVQDTLRLSNEVQLEMYLAKSPVS